MEDKWTKNPEHDRLYELSTDLTALLQQEFSAPDLRVQCGYEERVGYHFFLHGVLPAKLGKVADRARDWLCTMTPYRFEIRVEEI